jgi:hypothetical protein
MTTVSSTSTPNSNLRRSGRAHVPSKRLREARGDYSDDDDHHPSNAEDSDASIQEVADSSQPVSSTPPATEEDANATVQRSRFATRFDIYNKTNEEVLGTHLPLDLSHSVLK